MRTGSRNLVGICVVVMACALLSRLMPDVYLPPVRPTGSPSAPGGPSTTAPSSHGQQVASPIPPVDRSLPCRSGLRAPAMIGPSDRVAWAGPPADLVAADAHSVTLREGTRIHRVALAPSDPWRMTPGQWTCKSYPLSGTTTVTVGLADETPMHRETLGLEALVEGRSLPLPPFETLLDDERGWTHGAFNEVRYQVKAGVWEPHDYAIRGAFVGSGCVAVLLTWYATRESGSPPGCYRIVRLTPGNTQWQVEGISGDLLHYAHAVLIPFRDRFLVFDGACSTWFDAQGNLVQTVPWPYSYYRCENAQVDMGVMTVPFRDQDERESIGCSDPRSGRVLGTFSRVRQGGSTTPFVRTDPGNRQ